MANFINHDSTISYSPNTGFFGVDTLKYVLSDTATFCNAPPERDTATVLVYVGCNGKDRLNWNSQPSDRDVTDTTFVENGLLMNFSSSDPNGIRTRFATGNDFQSRRTVVWKQDPSTNAEESIATIRFNRKVDQFCLDLLDIDSDPAGFTDSVVVNAYQDGNMISLTPGDFILGTATDFKGNNSFTGNALVDDRNGTEGNASLCFFVSIDSIQIILANASSSPANPSEQSLGIGNLAWCAFPNNAPDIKNELGVSVDSLFYTIPVDSSLNICLNATDIDLDSLAISAISTPTASGTATVLNGAIYCVEYTPEGSFTGTETFRISICDHRASQLCDQVVISVLLEPLIPPTPPPVEEEFFVSDALSPNGDRILDHWEITGIERFPNNHIRIFNIWGDLVFQQSGYNNDEKAWRGEAGEGAIVGGNEAPDGTYFYILNLGNGQQLIKGYVVLKR